MEHKFCINCKHYHSKVRTILNEGGDRSGDLVIKCAHPKLKYVNLVTGQWSDSDPMDNRLSEPRCGIEGKKYEPKDSEPTA